MDASGGSERRRGKGAPVASGGRDRGGGASGRVARARSALRCGDRRAQEIVEADAAVEALADAVAQGVDLVGAVVGGVDVDAERALALGELDDAGDLPCDLGRIGAVGRQLGEAVRSTPP